MTFNVWILFLLISFLSTLVESLACYECSRGSEFKQELLLDLFFYVEDDESAQRARNHSSTLCGSNVTLDRTFRVYCSICQIAYVLHDPELTAIASCSMYGARSQVENNKYVVNTCSRELCNNFALNQDNRTIGNANRASALISMIVISFVNIGRLIG